MAGSRTEHGGMRTYFFSADTQEDMNSWIRAMNQAALVQAPSTQRSEVNSALSVLLYKTSYFKPLWSIHHVMGVQHKVRLILALLSAHGQNLFRASVFILMLSFCVG